MPRDLHTLNLAWLTRLRWAAIAGQLVTMTVAVAAFGVRLPWPALALILGAEAALNVIAETWLRQRRPIREALIGAAMVGDLFALTLLLFFTGGPTNPFNFLYLVHIALAAVVLRPRWTWALALLSMGLFALLFVASEPLVLADGGHAAMQHGTAAHGGGDAAMAVHTRGMWVAFAVAAGFIVYFASRINRELNARDQELSEARDRASRTERLAALATLAAGAAHELSTPLSTIAVVARELELDLVARCGDDDAEPVADARLIQAEVARCRAVLDRLAGDAGRPRGELVSRLTVGQLVAAMLDKVADAARVTVTVPPELEGCALGVQAMGLSRALKGLVDNAVVAAGAEAVSVSAARDGGDVVLVVADRGPGMAPELLARIGEPFFTTKEPGRGMGLGVFLARSVVAEHGGRLTLTSQLGQGTRADVRLPLERAAGEQGGERDA